MTTVTKELTFNFNGADTSYLTHSLHPYPAKFPPQLPQTILKQYSKKGETVLDPFCGSGTTLVEARMQGINSIGVDVNGLSCLLSKVKATPLSLQQIRVINQFIDEIKKLSDKDITDFLKIVLSSIIVRVSNQESDTRFAAINKNISNCHTFELFVARLKEHSKRIEEFSKLLKYQATLEIHNADSRNLSFISSKSIDLIITSPPYANTYDYYQDLFLFCKNYGKNHEKG